MKKFIVFGIVFLFISMSLVPPSGGIGENHNSLVDNKIEVTSYETNSVDNDTEYWALLVAVGIYAGHPDEDRPSMLEDVEKLHEKLLVSEHWKEENIKLIKGEDATVLNIVRGLRWLDRMDDKDDFSLVYITTHGFPLSFDIPPFDEEDKHDEALVTYRGFNHPWAIIWDDLLNFLLSLLNSKGVCVIIDSCYAGGFNDPPYFNNRMKGNNKNADEWMHEFAEDISGSGRVVLMSCSEDEVTYASVFTPLLVKGLTGYADINDDDLVSAEEVFDFVVDYCNEYDMHPTIYDDYPGEFQLTDVKYPPSNPETPKGKVLGETNTTYSYCSVSMDPEGDKICYGWDWDGDYIVDEWTDFVDSNTYVNTLHSWQVEGTYNIKVKAKDDQDLESDWSKHIVVSMSSNHIPDQRQTEMGGGTYMEIAWFAQSFIPSLSTLSKVELGIESWGKKNPTLIHMYIREDLTGENLAECSRFVPPLGYDKCNWSTFEFEDLNVIPGKTYYIICEKTDPSWAYVWRWMYSDPSPYPLGEIFESEDGDNWSIFHGSFDCCFVTWAKPPEYPIVFDPIPEDGDSWVPIDISQLCFNLKDYQEDLMNYTVETIPDVGTGNVFDIGDGKYSIEISGLEATTEYLWFVNVTDGEHWNSEVFSFKTQPAMVFDPFEEGWQYRKKITIDYNKVAGNVTDFPILISVADDDLKNKAHGDGSDILFMDNFGVANRLLHEIESFNNSSGELVAWINVTNLSSSADTVLYMYYGNSDCDSQEYPDHVWDSDYCGVWHLNDFLDSTSNNNDGTNYGTDSCSGKIGDGKDFVEDNEDYVSLGDMPEPADGEISKGTFEAWINPDELASRSIIGKLDTKLEPDKKSYNLHLRSDGRLNFGVWSGTWFPDGRSFGALTDDELVTSSTWQHIVVVADLYSKNFVFYYNGEEKNCTVTTEGTPPSYFYDINLDEKLGKHSPESSGPYFYDGSMDEVRISKKCRSAEWISTEYNNQNDPSNFLSFGPEEMGL